MLVPDRRRRALAYVRSQGSAQVEELAKLLGVSTWTVRRDLEELESQELLRRTHGGAYIEAPVATGSGAAPARATASSEVKERIGALAAERIENDSTVLLLAGSTTGALVPFLTGRRLTVVTNGIEIAYALRHAEQVSLVVLGGYLHREQQTLLGPLTETTMADLHVDLIVAGAYGVHPEVGITGAKIIQAGYHHGMLSHTDALMVLADSSKLGQRGPTLLADLAQVDTVITDAEADADIVSRLRQQGPEVLLA